MSSAKAFQFGKKRTAKPEVIFHKAQPIEKPDEGPMIIQGIPAMSKEEWHTAQALDTMQQRYRYQVSVYGGRSRRGGQVIDFLVLTPGKATVIDVRGSYWHTGKREDDLDIARVVRKKKWNLIVLWDRDCQTVGDALTFLRQKLPHG